MTKQEIFNKVTKHLLKQNKQCKQGSPSGGCVLKNKKGDKCALGALIPDKLYDEMMENFSDVESFFSIYSIAGIAATKCNLSLISDLQYCHDSVKPSNWYSNLEAIAQEYKLKFFIKKPTKKKK